MELVIDTETTGLTSLSFVTDRNYRKWPRLVQIAWGIITDNEVQIQRTEIIHPEGFQIPTDSIRVHGISQVNAMEKGKSLEEVLTDLNQAMKSAKTIIAHNLNFDLGILQSESMRTGVSLEFPEKRQCTAFLGQKYMRKERKLRNSDFPNLSDLHKELLGHEHSDPHKAHFDVLACGKIYIAFKKLGYIR
jgi:DNA polymerase III epsilon subunit-like protein